MSEYYNVRARNEATDHWFAVGLGERRHAVDLARALDASPQWSMVTLTRDAQESIDDWREP